jgi:acetolactate synthase I/II/III large subunit
MSTGTVTKAAVKTGADLLVESLEAQGIKHIFGIPGAKIDRVFNRLQDSSIETIVCRHEQNAAFIAGGIGRMTGKAGVVLVTSGPGVSNLATGLATATSEGDPVVAIGGAVAVENALKQIHQSMDQVALLRPVTKFSAEINSSKTVTEVVANAFQIAESGRPGAAYLNARMDIMVGEASGDVLTPVRPDVLGPATAVAISEAAEMINAAERPVLFLGMLASQPRNAEAVRESVRKTGLPVVSTYQAAGIIPRDLFGLFAGRVGLFRTQPADHLLDAADVVITVGYDPIEYEPALWNKSRKRNLIHIDETRSDTDRDYHPRIELTGNIAATVEALAGELKRRTLTSEVALLKEIARDRQEFSKVAAAKTGMPVHPMRIVYELQNLLTEDTTMCSDMGSFHIWLARHLYSFRTRQLLITNGQQTLGVGLPWAIAASLVRPSEKVISISGDGGFLFSAAELETAVRLKCNLVHIVWIDGSYDMVRFQEVAKYGRASGVDFGAIDLVKFAEAFGAQGMYIDNPDKIAPTLQRALEIPGPVVVGIPVDYSENLQLTKDLQPNAFF